ncbi:Translation initiation factor 3 subunit c [Basidiobolus ranarum]|uniref:Eukaryotic translation initiation factor 3 subunit C n=1 Tax=Basidiobolus ranarum TaxID=34480 RepID=A0ABR2WP00_9FUNG
MSRFFRGDSDSDSEDLTSSSSEESFYSSEEEKSDGEEEKEKDQSKTAAQGGLNRFMRGGVDEDSDDDEDVKRVVKSAKDKRYDEMTAAVKVIDNGLKINDWVTIASEFDKLTKLISKATTLISTSGVPKFYIRCLVHLEDGLKEVLDSKKKMNASNSKALNSMRQKLRKNNKAYEKDLEEFRKAPVEEEGADDESDEKDEDSDSDSDDESSAGVNKWLKKSADKPKKDATKKKTVEAASAQDIAADIDDGFTTVGKGGKVADYTSENLFKKLNEIIEARGKKNTDRTEQITILNKLLAVSATPYQKIKVLLVMVSSQFDYVPSITGYMPIESWKRAEEHINSLFKTLEEHPEIKVFEDAEEIDEEDKEAVKNATEVRGSIASFIERLDEEFIKSLQIIDPHTPEYLARLSDQSSLYSIIVRSQAYFESRNLTESLTRVIMKRLEHLYYKTAEVSKTLEESVQKSLPDSLKSHIVDQTEDVTKLIHSLCVYLYKNASSLLRTRAMLCHVFHHSIHDRFHVARDMLLMSHLQDSIHQADVATQILHNRTMVQLGLCAFREGMVKEAHACLQEISGTGRVKELLAQGLQLQKYTNLTPEQEKLEKQRQLPFHMHINLELLECVYLTCSMLLEIPSMAAAGSNPEARKKVISKPFRRLLDYSERQVFAGPPENTRDHIMGASKALAAGDWIKSRDLICSIKIWELIANPEHIKEMLARKIQEEGLRTYLFTYASYYSTVGLEQLGSMFDLAAPAVYSIVSKMIFSEEIQASLDQVKGVVVLHRVEPSRLQVLSLLFADKAASLVESNEKTLEQKVATPGNNTGLKTGQGNRRYPAGDNKWNQTRNKRSQVKAGGRS